MNTYQEIAASPAQLALPEWLQELRTGLAVRSQFAVSGNIRDLFSVHGGDGPAFLPACEAIWSVLKQRGYAGLLKYDPVAGTRLHHECDDELLPLLRDAGIKLDTPPRDLEALAEQLRLVASNKRIPIAFLLDYASQLCGPSHELDSAQRDFFIACDKIAHAAAPLRASERPADLPYNPIIWLIDRPNDLPDWFTVGNETIRSLAATLPNLEERFALAQTTLLAFSDIASLSAEECKRDLEQLALESDGMTLHSILAISELAHAEGIGLRNVSDAIRAYKIGTPSNPWKAQVMRDRIADGEKMLEARVKGQGHAVRKALDILIRSAMGLSGSQTSSRHGRPRGVLFFAGPTGVGKTELAKAITELLFGDEVAYHRFDMSEFSSENSESRLIGAPPGYVGHQDGGELVNAARSRPFSVFLFDEIEKAHPRILDKFLQIIDEGRLTDGRGETVYFSESLIIFTSNIGIFGDDKAMNMSLNILPSDTYDEIERKIVAAIREYFRFKLKRPELINRIGQNIVVFEFIRARSAILILENMLKKVFATVREEHGIEIRLTDQAMEQIAELCTYDLFDGGRGIGNRLETVLVNPLARLLFQKAGAAGNLTITGVEERDGEYRLGAAGG
jgi:DNA polymerase III delta prime subunit